MTRRIFVYIAFECHLILVHFLLQFEIIKCCDLFGKSDFQNVQLLTSVVWKKGGLTQVKHCDLRHRFTWDQKSFSSTHIPDGSRISLSSFFVRYAYPQLSQEI